MKIYLISQGEYYEVDFSPLEYEGACLLIRCFNKCIRGFEQYSLSTIYNYKQLSDIEIAIDDIKTFHNCYNEAVFTESVDENCSNLEQNEEIHEYIFNHLIFTERARITYGESKGVIAVASILINKGMILEHTSSDGNRRDFYITNEPKPFFTLHKLVEIDT